VKGLSPKKEADRWSQIAIADSQYSNWDFARTNGHTYLRYWYEKDEDKVAVYCSMNLSHTFAEYHYADWSEVEKRFQKPPPHEPPRK
jgi:hypothetical protein